MKVNKFTGRLLTFTTLLMISPLNAEESDVEMQAKYGVELSAMHAFDFEAQGVKVEFDLMPIINSGFELSVGFDYFSDLTYTVNDTELKHDATNFRYGIGYNWYPMNDLSVGSSVGARVAVKDIDNSFIDNGETSTYIEFDVEYKVIDSFSVVSNLVHDLGHADMDGGSSIGFGVKYNFGHTPKLNLNACKCDSAMEEDKMAMVENAQSAQAENDALQAAALVPAAVAASEVLNSQQALLTPLSVEQVVQDEVEPAFVPFYTVQLGSFSQQRSVVAVLNRANLTEAETFTRTNGATIKLYKGEFADSAAARAERNRLRASGVNGFVVYIATKD